jgi:hypothetical protein
MIAEPRKVADIGPFKTVDQGVPMAALGDSPVTDNREILQAEAGGSALAE